MYNYRFIRSANITVHCSYNILNVINSSTYSWTRWQQFIDETRLEIWRVNSTCRISECDDILQGEIYINGARFIEADIDTATNGILHVIDRIFIEQRLSSNAYTFIRTEEASRDIHIGSTKYAVFYFYKQCISPLWAAQLAHENEKRHKMQI